MPGRVNGHQQDDDCLSYSSTEHDVSIHDAQPNGSIVAANTSVPINMSFNNGMYENIKITYIRYLNSIKVKVLFISCHILSF